MSGGSRGRVRAAAAASLLLAAAACGTGADAGGSTSPSSRREAMGAPAAARKVPVSSDLLYTEGDDVGVLVAAGVKYLAGLGAPARQGHPDWSPDGKSVVFETGRTELWKAGAHGEQLTRIHRCRAPCSSVYDAAWSPDGKKIAFAAIESEDGKHSSRTLLKVIDLAAAQVRAVYTDVARPDRIVQPRWSPDGASLVFEQDTMDGFSLHPTRALSSRIGAVDLKGGKPRFIAFGRTRGPQTPDWGAHGIVFSRGGNLFAISPTGGPAHRLTAFDGTTQQAVQPTFSPDGRRIVFTYLNKGYGSAYRPAAAVINADGGGFALISGADGLTQPRLKP